MGTIATAYVQVMPSTQGIAQNLEDQFTPAGETAGKKAGQGFIGKFGKALVAAGAVKAVTDFFKASVKQGAELQQNIGGVSAVFGKAATDITSRAKQAYKNMGLSASEYMATANKMGALFQGSGLSQVDSMKLTTKAMQRAADVASVMGIETSSAMEAIAGAAKGNFTMMDNLGVAMNATTLQAYALEKGINFDWNTASQAEKAQLAMEMFFDRTSQYAGNFARESQETLSGSFGMLRASWTDFLGNLALGENVKESFKNVVRSVIDVGKNLLPVLGNIFQGIGEVAMEYLGPAWENVKASAASAWESIKTTASSAWGGIKQEVASGWEKVKAGVSWSTISSKATEAWNAFEGTISGAWNSITGAVSGAWQDVMNGSAWASISSKATEAWNAFEGTISGAWSSITGAVSGAWQDVMNGSAWTSISSKATEAWNAFEGTISGAFDAIGNKISEAWETVKGALSFKLPDFILGNLPKLPKIKITGSFSLVPLSVPTISWNKKGYDYPLLFNSPTVIPTAAGLQGFGDGHGAEVVMSLAKMREMVGLGDNGGVGAVDYEILATLQELRGAIEHMGVYLDGKSLVGGIINQVDSALGERDALTQRGIA